MKKSVVEVFHSVNTCAGEVGFQGDGLFVDGEAFGGTADGPGGGNEVEGNGREGDILEANAPFGRRVMEDLMG